MKRMFAVLVLVVVLTLTITIAAMAGGPHRATGSANFLNDFDRQFSFTANQTGDGFQAKGQGQLFNREIDTRIHFVIDCLNVVGNQAIVSGYVKHSNVWAVGDHVWFKVQDNGEGHNIDRATTLINFLDREVNCRSDFNFIWLDVGAGNIQVR